MAAQEGRNAEHDARLFVSPHLDDAILGSADIIASSHLPAVVTVFAGRPQRGAPLAQWDADCGFSPGDDVIGARRAEDQAALRGVGARPIWLEFRDDQYGAPAEAADIANALSRVIELERSRNVFFPLGMFHADHVRASDACLLLATRFHFLRWFVYADALYRGIAGAMAARRAELARRGYTLGRTQFTLDARAHARKREAIACYRSQLRGLASRAGYDDALQPEEIWRLLPSAGTGG